MGGWVYVISNRAMPELVKVGYSAKDPELRAEELNHTGAPHPYVVDYEVLVEEPYSLEQRTHRTLAKYSEGKEWFRCSAEVAIAAIRQEAAGAIIKETFTRANREEALSLQKQKAQKDAIEQHVAQREREIRIRYADELSKALPKQPFWKYWVGCSVPAAIAIAMIATKVSDTQLFWWSTILGAVAAYFAQDWHVASRKNSELYKSIAARRDEELQKLRSSQPFNDENQNSTTKELTREGVCPHCCGPAPHGVCWSSGCGWHR